MTRWLQTFVALASFIAGAVLHADGWMPFAIYEEQANQQTQHGSAAPPATVVQGTDAEADTTIHPKQPYDSLSQAPQLNATSTPAVPALPTIVGNAQDGPVGQMSSTPRVEPDGDFTQAGPRTGTDFTDPITAEMKRGIAELPTISSNAETPYGDATYQRHIHELQSRIAADEKRADEAIGGPEHDRPTQYAYKPETKEVMVNGEKIASDFETWKRAANMPADKILPMSVNAIEEDGYIPMTQDQFQAYIHRVEVKQQKERDRWLGIAFGAVILIPFLAWVRKNLARHVKATAARVDPAAAATAGAVTLLGLTILYRLAWAAVPFAALWWIWVHRH